MTTDHIPRRDGPDLFVSPSNVVIGDRIAAGGRFREVAHTHAFENDDAQNPLLMRVTFVGGQTLDYPPGHPIRVRPRLEPHPEVLTIKAEHVVAGDLIAYAGKYREIVEAHPKAEVFGFVVTIRVAAGEVKELIFNPHEHVRVLTTGLPEDVP